MACSVSRSRNAMGTFAWLENTSVRGQHWHGNGYTLGLIPEKQASEHRFLAWGSLDIRYMRLEALGSWILLVRH